jgi:uncharacterized hydrophobic protein (TIGR00271 family)
VRQLQVEVRDGDGPGVLRLAAEHGGTLLHRYEARSDTDSAVEILALHLPNDAVGRFVEALERRGDVRLTLLPQGLIVLTPPAAHLAAEVRDVSGRSPLEIFLGGLQSVGSWRGFLSYAAAAGAVVWLGLFTNAGYLLVAAMLIAPFAGPAMNAAIATARGDAALLGQALLRYVSSLLVTMSVAGVLSLIFRQSVITEQMAATANISSAAVVLPLAAGAAGALHLVQGERSSLVSGASVGMLVAASLAPPAGLTGIAVALGDWDLLTGTSYLLALQLVGINLSGALIFRAFGMRPDGARFARGRRAVSYGSGIVSLVVLGALLAWQMTSAAPELQRSTVQQRARDVVRQAIGGIPEVALAAVEAEFTRPDIPGQRTLLVRLYAQRRGTGQEDGRLRERITADIQRAVRQEWPGVTPLVDVTLLFPPGSP